MLSQEKKGSCLYHIALIIQEIKHDEIAHTESNKKGVACTRFLTTKMNSPFSEGSRGTKMKISGAVPLAPFWGEGKMQMN